LILRKDVKEFEEKLARFLGVKYAVGLSNGTDAIIFALKAEGIGSGDEVITVSHTFVATVAAIVHCGAKPVLIDVKESDFTMDPGLIEGAITAKTKAVIPVHLNGRTCDMKAVTDAAERHSLKVIEDNAQSLGARLDSKMAGTFGDSSTYSFYPAKILGCYGDAGALVTNRKDIYEKTLLLRDHGQKTKTEVVDYGFTGRMDNLQAAVLNIKIDRLPEWIERRRNIARLYDDGLKDIEDVKLPPAPDEDVRYYDVYQNYVLRAKDRDGLASYLRENGIEVLIKDPIALHRQEGLNLKDFRLPVSERLAKEVISIPMYPELSGEQVDYAIETIRGFYG
jgi:dTDP-4-amino-4,6-dideoxygalactose transaminase